MLAKNRDERYAGMKEFTSDLKARLVQSDTLMTRLHIDPNETSSEQLRALGFSTSSPTGEGLRELRGRLPSTNRTPPPATAAVAQTVASSPATPRWMWLTAAVGVILIAIGAWLGLHGRGGLSKDDQQIVALYLDHAELLAGSGKLLLPPDENAYTYVQKALQKDPENARAQALIESIGGTLAGQAQESFKAGKLDEATDLDNQALLVRPDDAASRALQTQIAQTRKAEQSKAQLQGLLERAESARVAGRIFGGDSAAYTLLAQAHALAPGDGDIQKRIDALVAQQLDVPRQALAAGQATAAGDELKKLEPQLGSEPAFATLRGDIATALKKQKVEKDLATLLARGNEQLRAGHLDEPGGNNAYETLGELNKVVADDQRVSDFAGAIGRALLVDARKLDGSGQSSRALERADLAVKVAPTMSDAQALKDQIELRLGARATKLAQTLGAARQAIAEQRFVPPATDDAYAALGAVLALDPGNADAKQMLAALPKRIVEAATMRAQTDAGAAVAMVDAARHVFVQDAALAALAQKLQAQLADEKSAAQAQASRERIAKVLAMPMPSMEQLRSGAKDLGDLLTANASDKEALALRTQLVDTIGADLQAAAGVVQFDALTAMLKEQEKLLASDRAYATLVGTLPSLRAKVEKAEQARAEAERGTLVLNAYPWGKVESVLDANRQPVALPADATTPLVLSLPAGSYVITFRHPQAAKPAQVIARVEAQKRATANAAFTTISTQEYFSRAGW